MMNPSANTFGTFLQTFGELEKQGSNSAAPFATSPSLKDVVGVVQDIAKNGDQFSVKDLLKYSNVAKDQVLSAVMGGRDQGLIELSEEQGEAIARLTSLGKLFVS